MRDIRVCPRARKCVGSRDIIGILIRPRQIHVLCEQAQDCEETREGPTTSDFVQQLISVQFFIRPSAFLFVGGSAGLRIDLDETVDDTVEVFVLIEGEGVARNETSSLEVTRKLVKNLSPKESAKARACHGPGLTGFSRKPKTRMASRNSSK